MLTGRRREPLEDVARRLGNSGAEAHVQPADLTDSAQVQHVGDFIRDKLGRLDILVNNAGVNIVDRHWDKLTPEGIDTLMKGNVMAALYCVTVALPFMRAQQDGVMIHTSSMAGRFIGGFCRTDLWHCEARRRGDEPHHQYGGVRQRHPLHACSCRARWRRRSSTSGPIRWDRRSARAWCSRRIAAT